MPPGTAMGRMRAITGTNAPLTRPASRAARANVSTRNIAITATRRVTNSNGPLRAIHRAAADALGHEPGAVAAVPRAYHRERHWPGAGGRHWLGAESAALRRRRGGGGRHRCLSGVAGDGGARCRDSRARECQAPGGLRGTPAARRPEHRHGGCHLGAVQHSRPGRGARRSAPSAPTRRLASLRRARAVPRPRRREMAGPPDAALDPLLGRLPPEPEAGRSPQVDGLPAHGARNRLRAWSTSYGVHVRGAGGALMGMRDRRPTTRVVD